MIAETAASKVSAEAMQRDDRKGIVKMMSTSPPPQLKHKKVNGRKAEKTAKVEVPL
jgi:hypothetical protein